jgi:hypothetical protein
MFTRVKDFVVLLNFLLMALALASCSSTSLMQSWKEAEPGHAYKHLLIIGVSDSQQTRQIYEKYFVAELKKRNVTATPSYKLINSKQEMSRETVVAAIQGTDIDAVLITYLVSADDEIKYRDSPLGTSYSGTAEGSEISATIVTNRGRSSSEEVFILKNDIYDAQSKTLVWSVQTKTVAPESIDEVVTEVTALLIDRMFSDDIIK